MIITLHPGADINAIQLRYTGANGAELKNGQVTLQLARPACLLESGPLAGCDASRSGAGLRLGDDRCDAIHLYWNFQTGQMAWWRH